ncbi:unnamed protein product [Rotaria sp. Silwood2]|nr:unnamed protein product [Rotaria sp. Silwood2]CAF3197937.1 unnamed protein product [Rotaria sp. Silwood2]CAF3415314.1 unnamed protein product [Rotaria sp. Silwood2]CAF4443494.1 unnamed protein product [Rotaria sp. Silwood2]CAF4557917.1 unnamed protein product [Rotaria sp. Silwood2]
MRNSSKFIPIRPYKSLNIDETTTSTELDKLIIEIKEINTSTIILYDAWSSSEHILQTELIKQSFSIKTIIQSSLECYVIHPKIKELLVIIFQSSATIQISNKSNKDLLYNRVYHASTNCDLKKTHFINIQESYKTCYNTTFSHNENCAQTFDFDDMDGPLCTCSHRPLKR